MPETRYIYKYTYPEGLTAEEKIPANAIIEQIPYEVSDEQLYMEQLEKECNETHLKVLLAINNWSKLTPAQKDELLKFLAKFYIVAGVRLGCFNL